MRRVERIAAYLTFLSVLVWISEWQFGTQSSLTVQIVFVFGASDRGDAKATMLCHKLLHVEPCLVFVLSASASVQVVS